MARIDADIDWLRKNSAGRRCDQKTLQQRFLAQPDGLHGLRPCAALAAQFSSSRSASICVHLRLKICTELISADQSPSVVKNLIRKIRVHSRSFAVRNLIPSALSAEKIPVGVSNGLS